MRWVVAGGFLLLCSASLGVIVGVYLYLERKRDEIEFHQAIQKLINEQKEQNDE